MILAGSWGAWPAVPCVCIPWGVRPAGGRLGSARQWHGYPCVCSPWGAWDWGRWHGKLGIFTKSFYSPTLEIPRQHPPGTPQNNKLKFAVPICRRPWGAWDTGERVPVPLPCLSVPVSRSPRLAWPAAVPRASRQCKIQNLPEVAVCGIFAPRHHHCHAAPQPAPPRAPPGRSQAAPFGEPSCASRKSWAAAQAHPKTRLPPKFRGLSAVPLRINYATLHINLGEHYETEIHTN